jgi:Protein of unknown function (DUF2786)/Phage integrase family
MSINRDNLIEKIRALMSKTVNNGCTEHEALAALDKARALMDAYEVTETELQLTKAETAILRSEPPGSRDPHGIKTSIAVAVSKFCDCRVWKASTGLVFCGLPADVRFATWLLDTLAATPSSGHMTFLVTEWGRPFTPAGFGNWFRDQCDQANLHHCSAHGLRKATAAALAEAGASAHEIAAVTGHMSLEEIERYTRAARKKKLADTAIARLK